MSSVRHIHPSLRRRGLATAATIAGAGAALSLLALSSSTSAQSTTITPAAGARAAAASVAAPVDVPAAAAPAPRSVAPQAPAALAPVTRVAPRKAAPAKEASPPHAMATTSGSCSGVNAAVDTFLQHVNAAHLALSPTEQVADAADVDGYTQAHTVLFGNMIGSLVGGGDAAVDSFLQHVYAAHLEASPGQQVADIADLDQYVTTHTVMVENMAKPLAGDLASC